MITNRVIWIVLDSVGMGPMPDSHAFGDEEPNTLGHIAQAIPGFSLPVMESIGLGNIDGMVGYQPVANPSGAFARMAEFSAGKDTTIGHWEMAGIQTTKPLPTYPNGFGPEIIQEFEARIGRGTLGNKPASGFSSHRAGVTRDMCGDHGDPGIRESGCVACPSASESCL